VIYRQQTTEEEEYDLEFIEARCDRLANGGEVDTVKNDDFITDDILGDAITRSSFFRDLRKVSRRIKPKSSPKESKT